MKHVSEAAGRVTVAGYSVQCPACDGYIPAPNSLIGLCLWSAEEVRDYPRAWCAACGIGFPVGAVARGDDGERR